MTNSNKRVVVTGASSGIGRATAVALANEGWKVVALARREERLRDLVAELGADACEPIVCDVTDDASVQGAVERILAGGQVKALINCAGGAIGQDRIAQCNVEDWRKMYDINVLGTLRITQKLLPALEVAPGGGTVVVISSVAGIEAYEGGAGYCAAKSAERVFAQTLRFEEVGKPLRVIDVSPGMVATEEFSLNRFHGDQAKADAVYAGVPNPLTAEDIAECIRWALDQPDTVDVDSLVVRPRAQASAQRVYHR
ncbi:NADP-dependent 3-hydroxy acid dehydrogenase YdfG [Bifidobacterium bohemicum]|uniref:Short-chain dehydrogenase/reductase SDR n=1 Tax=Bifidobacterium bohemicum DSM 22767 TaxID=1437606 RepID=A0A086ZHA7_9BIFI|nr:SDR family oxidoreductase [Bifidobacterium bohemicum]KFI45907.1 short-chain dehydrogenase/reductase SDR [Bifidobacterium bohemicum DSM 22767]SCC16872.1 NADP-dependent 3-hydroxy acid dehydrogenase YdfG [Bifidobacterium bohemicum]